MSESDKATSNFSLAKKKRRNTCLLLFIRDRYLASEKSDRFGFIAVGGV